jgi:glycosyltransferase 2 family protein
VSRWFKFFIKISISLVLLFWLLNQVQWAALWRHVALLPVWTLPVCVLLYLTAQWLSSWRWHVLLQQLGMALPQTQLFQWYMTGMLYNQLLPGTIGGDGYRVWQTASHAKASKMTASMAVLAERGSGLAVLVWLTAWLGFFQQPNSSYHIIFMGLSGLCLLGMVLVAFLPLKRWFPQLVLAQQLIKQPKAFAISLGLSVVIQGLMLVIHQCLAPDIPWYALGWAYGCVTILTMLPVSFNGIGLRELGYATMLSTVCPAEKAIALSLMWFCVGLLTSLTALPYLIKTPFNK